jgi:hypothetical protein
MCKGYADHENQVEKAVAYLLIVEVVSVLTVGASASVCAAIQWPALVVITIGVCLQHVYAHI